MRLYAVQIFHTGYLFNVKSQNALSQSGFVMKMSKDAIYVKKGAKDPQILKTKSDLKKLKIGKLFFKF